METIDNLLRIIEKLYSGQFKIFFVIIIAFLIFIAIKYLTPLFMKISLLRLIKSEEDKILAKRRIDTLTNIIETTSLIVILVYLALFILSELAIDVVPLIAGAGVVTFAVAFGSQSLIKDFISGIFIILENQYNVGDRVEIEGFKGKVIDINFRRTILQTHRGARHIIPNGTITAVTNMTNSYSVLSIDVPVKVDANFDKAYKIIDKICKKTARKKIFKEDILEDPERKGVNDINNNSVIIRIWGKTKPGKHIFIKRFMVEEIAKEFSKNKISLPGLGFGNNKESK